MGGWSGGRACAIHCGHNVKSKIPASTTNESRTNCLFINWIPVRGCRLTVLTPDGQRDNHREDRKRQNEHQRSLACRQFWSAIKEGQEEKHHQSNNRCEDANETRRF